MSRGTPHISLRVSPDVLAGIDAEVERVNRSKGIKSYNRTSFIMHAVQEKLDKLERGRKSSKRKGVYTPGKGEQDAPDSPTGSQDG